MRLICRTCISKSRSKGLTVWPKTRLFKYLSPDGAKSTLSTCSVRFSRPSSFNDPFDMRIDEILGLDFRQFAEEQKLALFELLSGELDTSSLRPGELGRKAALINEALRKASPDQKRTIKDELLATPLAQMYDFARIEKSRSELVAKLKELLNRCGLYCMTLRHDSLLMWSHYAQSHQGIVLEFAPDAERDSVLCASRPVRYKKERPLVYRSPSDLVRNSLTMSLEASANQILDNLVFTKSPEWEYEQEFRVAIPTLFSNDSGYRSLKLAPSEFVAVYLGCRIASADKKELIDLARSLNQNVEIYQTQVSSREYALLFEPLEC